MREMLRANFTLRRTLARLMALACFTVCIVFVAGGLSLPFWAAIIILFVGLLAYEWAG